MVSPSLIYDTVIYSNLLVLMTIGLTFTYITLKTPNFAHGDFVTIGAYTVFTLHDFTGISIYLGLPMAFLVAGGIALAAYFLIFRPLAQRKAGIAVMMIAYLTAEVFIWSSLAIYADALTRYRGIAYFGFVVKDPRIEVMGHRVPEALPVSVVLAAATLIGLYLLFTKTRFGIALRAAIENPQLASAVGIDVDKAYAVSWFLAGALTGLAGPIAATRFPFGPAIGWYYILRIFAASMLGGISSIWGAAIGAYIVGISEIMGIYYLSGPPFHLSTVYRVLIPFTILIVTLMVAPQGITGVDWRDVKRRLYRKLGRGG